MILDESVGMILVISRVGVHRSLLLLIRIAVRGGKGEHKLVGLDHRRSVVSVAGGKVGVGHLVHAQAPGEASGSVDSVRGPEFHMMKLDDFEPNNTRE
jgi:hypothetical protein